MFEIDQFFPPADRTKLAFTLNALVASPTFAAWGEGEPLDPQTLLFTADGKPRCAVVYLAHLSEEERQFVVTLVFSKLVTWMRGQEGTPDLRALAYMDEVFGYVPPTAAPPPKKPILTIFKQGRAFGLGLVLSTQNPVDLDYKAMSNAGTWLVGRLQTENDKARVLEGLRSAAGTTDVAELDTAIGGLEKRQFLLVSAKASTPRLLATRWAMSYLRGPLTKEQVARLRPAPAPARIGAVGDRQPSPRRGDAAPPRAGRPGARARTRRRSRRPSRPASLSPTSTRPRRGLGGRRDAGSTRLRAFLAARVSLRYDDSAADVDEQEEFEAVYGPLDGGLDLASETQVDYDDRDFSTRARRPGVAFVLPQAPVAEPRFFAQTAKDIQRHLVERRPLELQRNRALKLVSRPGESPDDFAQRCDAAAQERADAEAAKIRDRLEAKRDRLDKALAQAQRRVEELDTDTRTRQANELIAGAGAVLGALFGGRRSTRSMASAIGGAASRRGMTARTSERRETAEEKVDATTGRPRRSSSRRSSTRSPRSTSAGRRRPTRSTRSRSGSRRPTSACSRRGSCGCRATDPARARRGARGGLPGLDDDGRRRRRTTGGTTAVVEWVNDGDTLTLTNGAKVRLVQIDAPELETDCYGRAALQALIALAPKGTRVPLAADPALDDRDRYGRLLRYVFVGDENVNVELVRARRGVAVLLPERARRATPRSCSTPWTRRASARRGYWGACPGAELNTGLGSITGRR